MQFTGKELTPASLIKLLLKMIVTSFLPLLMFFGVKQLQRSFLLLFSSLFLSSLSDFIAIIIIRNTHHLRPLWKWKDIHSRQIQPTLSAALEKMERNKSGLWWATKYRTLVKNLFERFVEFWLVC